MPWTIDFALAPGRPILSLYDQYDQSVPGEEWRVPDELWASFPIGQPVLWRVRLLPDRARGQTELDAPSSGFSALVRAGSV